MEPRPRCLIFGTYAAVFERELARDGRFHILANSETTDGALRAVLRTKPDILVLDVGSEGFAGLALVGQVSWQAPYVTILVVSRDTDLSEPAAFMQAGADGFLVWPFRSGYLPEHLFTLHEQVYARKRHWANSRLEIVDPRRPCLVTVFSPKGGVGKTTLSVNLAVGLALVTDGPIILLDVDVEGGDTGVALDVTPRRTLLDFARANTAQEELRLGEYLTPHSSGIQLLAAPPSPEHADLVRPADIRTAIELARQSTEFVVADTAPAFNDQVLATLDESDRILMVLTPDVTSVKNVKTALDLMAGLKYPKEKVSLVVNRAANLGLSIPQIEEALGCPVMARIPNDPQVVTAANNSGQPFILGWPDSDVARATVALATQMAREIRDGLAHSPRRKAAWWRRLLGLA